jgi:phosphate transport system protein
MLLQMSSIVEEAVRSSILSIQRQDINLASLVISRDKDIDMLEMKIDNLIINTLVLQQPMAGDLRFLLSATQIAEQLPLPGTSFIPLNQRL